MSIFLFLIKYVNEITVKAVNRANTPVKLLVKTKEKIGNIDKKYHLKSFLARYKIIGTKGTVQTAKKLGSLNVP